MHAFFFSENIETSLPAGAAGWFPSTLDNSPEFIAWIVVKTLPQEEPKVAVERPSCRTVGLQDRLRRTEQEEKGEN